MKKTLLAAALAAGSFGVAQAQTVTLYGIIDGGLQYEQYKVAGGAKATHTGFVDGGQAGNRFGLRGVEDLGGGLKIEFKMENAFNMSTGANVAGARMFHREATIALASDSWGRLTYGRQPGLGALYISNLANPWGDSYQEGTRGATFTSSGTRYTDNVIKYETPVFSGFQAGVWYSFNAEGASTFKISGNNDTNVRLISLGLRYNNGPLRLAAVYDQADSDNWTTKAIHGWVLAGSYDFDVAKIHLGVGQDRNGVFNNRGGRGAAAGIGIVGQAAYVPGTGYRSNNYSLGVTVPTGTGDLMAEWTSSRLSNGAFKTAAAKTSFNTYSVVYNYPLSKRTFWYSKATYTQGFAFNDAKATQIFTGLDHRF